MRAAAFVGHGPGQADQLETSRGDLRSDAELLAAAAPRLSVVGVASVGIDRWRPGPTLIAMFGAMAAAFIAVSQAAVTAPLNPGYRQEEFAFYLSDLKAKAIAHTISFDDPGKKKRSAVG